MHIQLNDEYRLYGDRHSYAIQSWENNASRDGGGQWRSILYYDTLSGAISAYTEFRLRTSDVDNLIDALDKVKEIKHEISAALAPEYTILDESGNMV